MRDTTSEATDITVAFTCQLEPSFEGENIAMEDIVDTVTDELITLGYDNAVVSASIPNKSIRVIQVIERREEYLALDSALRSALHAAGVGTPTWPTSGVSTSVRAELIDA
jgi:hypothetical protein